MIKIARAIRKYLHDKKVNSQKSINMCFKRWFTKPDPVIPPLEEPHQSKVALLFAINNYGGQNNLNGCLNDQRDMADMLNTKYSGFAIKKFSDAEVTRNRFISEVTGAISKLIIGDVLIIHFSGHGTQVIDRHGDEADGYDEAIYLHDGVVIDDDIGNSLKSIPDGATVVLMFDSCFSGTVTRAIKNPNIHRIKNRFIKTQDLPATIKKRVRIPKTEMKWIVFSGCGEQQTSADAYINKEYHGAFTYYFLKGLSTNMNYNDLMVSLSGYLPSKYYDQKPELEGKTDLFTKTVFT